MTNKEAYERDLKEITEAINTLLAAVPQAKNKKQEAEREKLEYIASQAIANLECMSNDYIVKEVEELPVTQSSTPEPFKRPSAYERTRAAVHATGNRWAIENFHATHG